MVRLAQVTAALALFGLGFIYGRGSFQATENVCEPAQPVNAQIIAIHKIESERVQYVMQAGACKLLVTSARFPLYAVGEVVQLTGAIQQILDFPPDLAGYAGYLSRQGISGTVRYPEIEESSADAAAGWRGAGSHLREQLRERVIRIFPEPEASAVLAMVFGQVGTLPPDTIEDFRRVGVSHILAISGMNLSLLAGAILAFSFLLPLQPWARAMLVVLFMWFYVWLIVYPVSAVRAAWFWTFALAGLQLKLLMGLPAVFVLAVASMMTLNPRIILDIGFQLSVSAVAGMWLAAFLTPAFAKASAGRHFFMPRWLRLALLATVGATITTWPIVAYHFGIVSLVSLFANILIVPTTSAFMILSLLAILISFWPLPALALSFGVHLLWRWMTGVAGTLSAWPAAAMADISLAGWFLPVYYGGLVALAIGVVRWQRRSWREVWA